MSRAIVLIVCLTAAGAVAAYTHYSQTVGEPTPVFTVHAPDRNTAPAAPVPRPVQPSQRANPIPGDRASLVRELQRELKRVGCYSGDVNGVWTTSSRMAMKSVTDPRQRDAADRQPGRCSPESRTRPAGRGLRCALPIGADHK